MLLIAYLFLVVLIGAATLLHKFSRRKGTESPAIVNPAFLNFQQTYFNVYLLALFAEWLQSPYIYRIYSHYDYIDTQISVIYVCGFISSIIFGMVSGYIGDQIGRKKTCVVFCVVYSVCCLTKASSNYGILIFGRVLGGLSTSILFSTFESWYVYQHTEAHDFPLEWITATFTKATYYNGFIAITAGISANMFVEWLEFGPVSPFILAIVFLMVSAAIIQYSWDENYGGKSVKIFGPCIESLRLIVQNSKILLIGVVTSLFESVTYIFVFLWTPVLDPAKPPLGIVFACFMACVMIGGVLFDVAKARKVSPMYIVMVAILVGLGANVGCALASARHPQKTFLAFLCFEVACGLYFPAMGWLRRRVLPEAHHAGIMNWFRVPLNITASVVLLLLHDTHSSEGITAIFGLCSVLMIIAGLCSIKLVTSLKIRDEANDIEEENNLHNAQNNIL